MSDRIVETRCVRTFPTEQEALEVRSIVGPLDTEPAKNPAPKEASDPGREDRNRRAKAMRFLLAIMRSVQLQSERMRLEDWSTLAVSIREDTPSDKTQAMIIGLLREIVADAERRVKP